jgi:hypothetical protein
MSFLFGDTSGGAGTKTPTVHHLRVSDSQYGTVLPIVYGRQRVPGHTIWTGDFKATSHKGPGKGLEGSSSGTFYTYSISVMEALCLGPIAGVGRLFGADVGGLHRLSKDKVPIHWNIFTGQLSQGGWSYLASHHPGQDVAYTGLAYVAQANRDLGKSAVMPQQTWEVFGIGGFSSSIPDANPSTVIIDMVTNATYGMDPGATWLDQSGTFATYANYCTANNFFVSATIDQQKEGREWLALFAELTHAEIVWSEGQMRIVPYATQPVTGNGVTWTPSVDPVMSFTDDDYIVDQPGTPPITIKTIDPQTRNNVVKVEYCNVNNDYNIEPIEVMDESDMLLLGTRRDVPRQYHPISNAAMGTAIAQLKLQWMLYVNRTYTFKVPPTIASLLDPMDVISITDSMSGIVNLPVRIVSIDEAGPSNKQGYDLTFTCEDVGPDTTPGYQNTQPVGGGTAQDSRATPPPINQPFFFEPNFIYNGDPYQIWIGISGQNQNVDWGGCNVFMSTDNGSSYNFVGTCTNPATMGTLLATFPTGSDPDTTNTLQVDLTEVAGTLTAGSNQNADQGLNLCWVDGELICFSAVTAGANQYQYNLGSYLRRGLYGTPIAAHAANAGFVYLGNVRHPDQGVTVITYPTNMVGRTLFFKFTSFNLQEGNEQTLDEADAYQYVVQGPVIRPIPPANPWAASTQYPAGSIVAASNNYSFEAIIGGTSGAGTPNWPNDINATIQDGSVVWQNIGTTLAITETTIAGAGFASGDVTQEFPGAVINSGGWVDVINADGPPYSDNQFISSATPYGGPIEMVFTWWSSGQLDFVIYNGDGSSGINGYFFRCDNSGGVSPVTISRVDNGTATLIGTRVINNPSGGLTPDWHKITIVFYSDSTGLMQMYLDGELLAYANDTTYAPDGPVMYAHGQTSPATRFKDFILTTRLGDLSSVPDSPNRAIPSVTHLGVAETFTYTVPQWANHLLLYLFGGGGGSSSSAGGGAGSSVFAYITVTPGAQYTCIVGAGGVNGGGGGSTSFRQGNTILYQAGGGAAAVGTSPGGGGVPQIAPYTITANGIQGTSGAGQLGGAGPGGKGADTGLNNAGIGKIVLVPAP